MIERQIKILRVGGELNVSATRIGGNLVVSVKLVCSVNKAKNYVRVLPEYVWLVPENNYSDVVIVEADVDWVAL